MKHAARRLCAWLIFDVRQSMRASTSFLCAICILAACEKSKPVQADFSAEVFTAAGGAPAPEGVSVNRNFPGGSSVMTAAQKALPGRKHINLSMFKMGADSRYEYVLFFASWDIEGSFESIYHRTLAFAKRKSDLDWSQARVFDWPGSVIDDFNGPIEVLEAKGKELGK